MNIKNSIISKSTETMNEGIKVVRERFQKYLEDSRQTKPSIYIIQTLGPAATTTNNAIAKKLTTTTTTTSTKSINSGKSTKIMKLLTHNNQNGVDDIAKTTKIIPTGTPVTSIIVERNNIAAERAERNINNDTEVNAKNVNDNVDNVANIVNATINGDTNKRVVAKKLNRQRFNTRSTSSRALRSNKSLIRAKSSMKSKIKAKPNKLTQEIAATTSALATSATTTTITTTELATATTTSTLPQVLVTNNSDGAFPFNRSKSNYKIVTKKSLASKEFQVSNSSTAVIGVKNMSTLPKLITKDGNKHKINTNNANNANNNKISRSSVSSCNLTEDSNEINTKDAATTTGIVQQKVKLLQTTTTADNSSCSSVSYKLKQQQQQLQQLQQQQQQKLQLQEAINAITNKVPKTKDATSMTSVIETKDSATQSTLCGLRGIHYITTPCNTMENPLIHENGNILYIYYELDLLIVVQELRVSFWKYARVLNMLTKASTMSYNKNIITTESTATAAATTTATTTATEITEETAAIEPQRNCSALSVSQDSCDASTDWIFLGHCKRLITDIEVTTPYTNRICINNSTPVYMELRCQELLQGRRDCVLLHTYINVYYFNDDEIMAKMHSVQLDTVQSIPENVTYTTIPESRYFIMCWPQANSLSRKRTGLCKYSLTPHLDTLASIREFKSMRHEIRQLECIEDDKLIGFGDSQITIWDHRSGDVLMNYDLHIQIGRNLGSIYYSCLDIGQTNRILLFQYIKDAAENATELTIIACDISHTNPTHRVLQRQELPPPEFSEIINAVNTSEHIVITAQSDDEIWISCADPNLMTCVPAQNTKRFYMRGRTQLIELTETSLMIDSFANHILKLAANNLQCM